MAKFCADCGAELSTKGKFCGECGTAVPVEIQHCPTCGQEWDGKKKKAEPVVEKRRQAATPKVATPVVSTPVAVNQSSNKSTRVLTSAVRAVYGPLYVEGKDCPNCGSANMANKKCKTCESEN